MTSQSTLNVSDVKELIANPSNETRAKTAAKVAQQFVGNNLNENERAAAEDIIRLMMADLALNVRKSLAQTISASKSVPHDIAWTLANDVIEVAQPLLEASGLLSDDDLMAIIRNKTEDFQVAIAGRKHVSSQVANALVDTGSVKVVSRLVVNEGADLPEATMIRVLDKFGDHKAVVDPIALRNRLPVMVAERLVNLVSDAVRDHLVMHHELSADVATDLLLESRERATLYLFNKDTKATELFALIDQMYSKGRLTPTLIARSLVMGDISFFEAALAKHANISVANAYRLVHDRGQKGLASLLERANMPPSMLHIARAALAVAEDFATQREDRYAQRSLMMERILTQFEMEELGDIDYFIHKMTPKHEAA